jgi:hypothetical protein
MNFISPIIIFFKIIRDSFYNGNLYRAVFYHWGGTAVKYLLALSIFINIPIIISSINDTIYYKSIIEQVVAGDETNLSQVAIKVKDFINQIPEIKIIDNTASVNVEEPYFIKTDDGMVIGIIDTKNIGKNQNESFLFKVTNNGIIVNLGKETYQTTFADNNNIPRVINGEVIINLMEKMGSFIWISEILYITILIFFFFISSFMTCLFNAMLVKIIPTIIQFEYNFKSLLRLSIISATAGLIIKSLLPFVITTFLPQLSGFYVEWGGMISYGIIFGYFLFAISHVSKVSKK